MVDAPERIWTTGRFELGQYASGSWNAQSISNKRTDFGEIQYVRADLFDALTEECDRLVKANAELKPLLQNIGDGIANMFDQLVKGNWRDDHDHDVKMNVHMLNLQDVLKQIMRFRADYLDYSEPNFDKHKATSTEREGE